jgi:hypothetical protein
MVLKLSILKIVSGDPELHPGASRTFWEEYVRPESMIVYTLGVYCMLKLCLLKVAILDGGQGHQTQFWKLTT